MISKSKNKPKYEILTLGIPLLLLLTFVLIPLIWAVLTSFKDQASILNGIGKFLPNPVTFDNYKYVWGMGKFSKYFSNSLVVAVSSVVFIVLFSLFNGYAISRFNFRFKNLFIVILLCTQLIPSIMVMLPLFIIYKNMGIINNLLSLIITSIVSQIPFNTLLMKSFISSVPVQLDEAAMVDGATRFRIIFSIIPPIILPAMVAVASFAFIGCWNEFLAPFSFLTSQSKYTISLGLKTMIGEFNVEYGALAAGSIIALGPPLLLFAYVQKYLVSGLSAGSVKG